MILQIVSTKVLTDYISYGNNNCNMPFNCYSLLLHDKIVYKNKKEHKAKWEKVSPNLPDILVQPKPMRNLSMPNTANESQVLVEVINPDNLEIEYDENEEVSIQIPQEELDEVFSKAQT